MSDYTDLVARLREWGHEDFVDAADAIEALQARVAQAEAALARAEQDRDHWRQEYKTLEGDIQRTVIAQRDELKAALAAEQEKSRVLADEKKEAVRLGQLHWEDWDRAEKALAAEREAHERTKAQLTEALKAEGAKDVEVANLLVYLHATEDEDGIHHPDWVARTQAAEAALARADALLRDIVESYGRYRQRGVIPAPEAYADMVQAINHAAAYLREREGGAA